MRLCRILLLPALAVLALVIPTAPAASAAQVIPGFEVVCFYSHTLEDDPIVFPGLPGAAHSHDFLGNRSVNASSTTESLRRGSTNCRNPADTAAYWTPVLYQDGRAVHPDRLHAYYRWGNVPTVERIQPFPAGLKIIAGDAQATGPQSTQVIGWGCGVPGAPLQNHPVSCGAGQKIVLNIFFPNCWDGTRFDSPDHRSHMAYSRHGSCPASHPVIVPRLTQSLGYPITSATGITLSSGAYYTAHADFWNTWNQPALEQLVRGCINAGRQCGPVTGPVS